MIGSSTIALCLLVRDDGGLIAHKTAVLPPVVDAWVAVDVGSFDTTAQTISRLWADRPGVVHHRPWRDLATNRTELLELADGAADYLLLLEADEVLFGSLPVQLSADAYEIRSETDPSTWDLRLLRTGLGWRSDSYLPARLVADGPIRIERHAGGVVHRRGTGGLRSRAVDREERRLVAASLHHPTDPDLAFQLAELYSEIGKVGAAIDMYRRRAAMDGDDEDGFFAAYRAAALTLRGAPTGVGTLHEDEGGAYAAYRVRALSDGDESAATGLSSADAASTQSSTPEPADLLTAAGQATAPLNLRAETEAAIEMLLAAWARRPTRVEPLYEAAVACRVLGEHARALELTERGAALTIPDDRRVHRWMFEWGIHLEHAAALAHLGRLDEAIEIAEALLEQDGFAPYVDVELLLTRQWLEDEVVLATGEEAWRRPLTTTIPAYDPAFVPVTRPRRLEELVGPVPNIYLGGEMEKPWTLLNPSVANGGDGFGIMLRAVSWRYREDTPEAIALGRYVLQGSDSFVRNRNFLQLHDADGDIISTAEITEPRDRPRTPLRIRGFEDCRLFWWRDAWHAAFVTSDVSVPEHYQMGMARIDGERFTDFVQLLGPFPVRDEKNWMPFLWGDRLLFVHGCHPFVVLEWDPKRFEATEVRRVATPVAMADLRGGSQGVRIDDGWVFLVHERRSWSRPLYVHQLLKVDDSLTPVGLSPPFVLQRYGIEFAAGMATWGSDFLISFGVQDRTAWMSAVPQDRLLALLEPIELPPQPTWSH